MYMHAHRAPFLTVGLRTQAEGFCQCLIPRYDSWGGGRSGGGTHKKTLYC